MKRRPLLSYSNSLNPKIPPFEPSLGSTPNNRSTHPQETKTRNLIHQPVNLQLTHHKILSPPNHVNITQDNIQPYTPRGIAGSQPIFRPPPELPEVTVTSRCIENITQTNQQVATTPARQNLPKCHPDIFDGDATLFHPWKNSFKAMIRDASLNPSQEITYLCNYTKGKAQDLVDNFRKRHVQSNDPASTLNELWNELERHFGNNVILTNALLEKLLPSLTLETSPKYKYLRTSAVT